MWYDEAVIYQIYPLGLCGAPLQNDGDPSQADQHRLLRVLDESGEDYLFPAACFTAIKCIAIICSQFFHVDLSGSLSYLFIRRKNDADLSMFHRWITYQELCGLHDHGYT